MVKMRFERPTCCIYRGAFCIQVSCSNNSAISPTESLATSYYRTSKTDHAFSFFLFNNLSRGGRTQSAVVYRLQGKIGKKSQSDEDIRARFSLAGEQEGAWRGPSSRRDLVCVCVVVLGSDRFFLYAARSGGFSGWEREGGRVGSKELNEVFEGWGMACLGESWACALWFLGYQFTLSRSSPKHQLSLFEAIPSYTVSFSSLNYSTGVSALLGSHSLR